MNAFFAHIQQYGFQNIISTSVIYLN